MEIIKKTRNKGLIIASDRSGGGKTTVTMGLIKSLTDMGYKVQGYKVGPDYIDASYHTLISGRDSRNLDLHLMGEDGVRASISRGDGEVTIVEGVMGFYDGIGLGSKLSTAHIANIVNLPVLLVLSPEANMATLFAQINGILAYEKNNIIGVILTNISMSYYKKLKKGIERYCKIKVFGYIPSDEHLSEGMENFTETVSRLGDLVERNIDIQGLIKSMGYVPRFKDNFHFDNKGLNIAIARDRAFNFYYKENIEFLEEVGKVQYFSPIEDSRLPDNIDFLYIGSGYIDKYYKELSSNISMLRDIKDKLDRGLRCYCYGYGFLYLTKGREGYPFVGFFDGSYYLGESLQNFGYSKLIVNKENPVLNKGLEINCQEYHKSCVELNEKTIFSISKDVAGGEVKSWQCGYQKNNTIGTHTNIHCFSNIDFFKSLLDLES